MVAQADRDQETHLFMAATGNSRALDSGAPAAIRYFAQECVRMRITPRLYGSSNTKLTGRLPDIRSSL
jgi:hypothetical protein